MSSNNNKSEITAPKVRSFARIRREVRLMVAAKIYSSARLLPSCLFEF